MHIREFNQIWDFSKFGKEQVQIRWKCWKNVKIIGFLVFSGTLLLSFQGKIETISLDFPEKFFPV